MLYQLQVPFLKKGKGYFRSFILGVIDLLLIRYQCYLSANALLEIYFTVFQFLICHNYNHGHNILRIMVTLPNFLCTTAKTKHDYK